MREQIKRWVPWILLVVALGCGGFPTPGAATFTPSSVPPTATWTPTATATLWSSSTATLRPTATLRSTSTLAPTLTPTATPEPPPSAVPTVSATVFLEPMNYQRQARNNCGPASIAIVLGYYGHWVTQQKVNEKVPAGSLTPCDVVLYMPAYGLMARLFYSPPANEPIRQLLDNRIPVIFNQWLSSDRSVRHYRVIRGYDDATAEFIAADPLLGPYFRISYDTFTTLSDPGNFIPVYPSEMDSLVQSLMGGLGVGEIPCP